MAIGWILASWFHVRLLLRRRQGVFIVVRRSGHGFDPNNIPNPFFLAVENLDAEPGRHPLMKLAMDEVSFDAGGTEVQIPKEIGK